MISVLKNIKITDRKSALKYLGLSLLVMAFGFVALGLLARVCAFFFLIGYSLF